MIHRGERYESNAGRTSTMRTGLASMFVCVDAAINEAAAWTPLGRARAFSYLHFIIYHCSVFSVHRKFFRARIDAMTLRPCDVRFVC